MTFLKPSKRDFWSFRYGGLSFTGLVALVLLMALTEFSHKYAFPTALLLKSLSNKLISQLDLKQDPKFLRLEERNTNFSDGEFDAFVAWLLGRLWLDDGPVKLDGNKFQGAWLVPILPESDKARKS